MGKAAETYVQQLEHHGHGLALWYPNPALDQDGERPEEARLGDVGFIDEDGLFHRFFNAMAEPNDEINKGGVPEGFTPLKPNKRLISNNPDHFDAIPITSRSIKSHEAGAKAGVTGTPTAGAGVEFAFHCSDTRGAMLILRDRADKQMMHSGRRVQQYIAQNHASWVTFATETLDFDIKPDDIIFVKGTIKTSAWTVAAVYESRERSHQLSLQAQAGPLAEVGCHISSSYASRSSIEHRSGPRRAKDGSLLPDTTPYIPPETPIADVEKALMGPSTETLVPGRARNQPVFLSYFKVKSRRIWPGKKVVANAGAHELPGAEDPPQSPAVATTDDDEDVSVEMHPPHRQLRMAVNDVLDYILERTDAEVAVVSDEEISQLFQEGEWPENIKAWLKEYMPTVEVDEDKMGMLSPYEGVRQSHYAAAAHQQARADEELRERTLIAQREAEERDMQRAIEASHAEQTQGPPEGEFVQGSSGQSTGQEATGQEAPGEDATGPEVTGQEATTQEPTDEDIAMRENSVDPSGGSEAGPSTLSQIGAPDLPEERLSGIISIAEGQATLGNPDGSDRTSRFTHTLLFDKSAEGGSVTSVSVSKNGQYIATGCEDCSARIWDLSLGSLVAKFDRHEDTVWTVAFSPDSSKLISGGADNMVNMWDVETRDLIQEMPGHTADVWSSHYAPNGKWVATGAIDCTVRLWNGKTGAAHGAPLRHDAVVMSCLFSPDSTRLLSVADSTAYIWDPATCQPIARCLGHESVIWGLNWSADGSRVITAAEDHTSRVWHAEGGDELVTFREHTGPVWSVAFSPDGREVASGSYDAIIAICDSYTGERHHLLDKEPATIVNTLAYSADGDFLASGHSNGNVKVWDAHSGSLVAGFDAHEDKVKSVEWSPDDCKVISSSDDGSVRIWNIVDALRL